MFSEQNYELINISIFFTVHWHDSGADPENNQGGP